MPNLSELLEAAEASGEILLKFCQTLRSQGINLSEHPRILQLLSQLETTIGSTPQTTKHPTSISIAPQTTAHPASNQPQQGIVANQGYAELIKPGILQPNDPRIAKIGELHILHDLQHAIRAGTARSQFPVGTVIPDTWTDTNHKISYSMPLIIVDYRKVSLNADKQHPGAILLRQNALPVECCFGGYTSFFVNSVLRHWLNDHPVGYTAGCSDNLLQVANNVIIDDGILVHFFPPSLEEMHFDPYDNSELENLVWEYFRDTPTRLQTPCPKRIFLDPLGNARTCCLRTENPYYWNIVWLTTKIGSADYYSAYATDACTPACVIT